MTTQEFLDLKAYDVVLRSKSRVPGRVKAVGEIGCSYKKVYLVSVLWSDSLYYSVDSYNAAEAFLLDKI